MKKAKEEVRDLFRFSRALMENPGLAEELPAEIFIPSGVKLSEILSEKRLELLAYIAGHPGKTVNELSSETGRKKAAVSRDLGVFGKHNLVSVRRKGRQKRVGTSVKYILVPVSG